MKAWWQSWTAAHYIIFIYTLFNSSRASISACLVDFDATLDSCIIDGNPHPSFLGICLTRSVQPLEIVALLCRVRHERDGLSGHRVRLVLGLLARWLWRKSDCLFWIRHASERVSFPYISASNMQPRHETHAFEIQIRACNMYTRVFKAAATLLTFIIFKLRRLWSNFEIILFCYFNIKLKREFAYTSFYLYYVECEKLRIIIV